MYVWCIYGYLTKIDQFIGKSKLQVTLIPSITYLFDQSLLVVLSLLLCSSTLDDFLPSSLPRITTF